MIFECEAWFERKTREKAGFLDPKTSRIGPSWFVGWEVEVVVRRLVDVFEVVRLG